MTDVHIEQDHLGVRAPVIIKRYGQRVRLTYDPRLITETHALRLLRVLLPRPADEMRVIRRHARS